MGNRGVYRLLLKPAKMPFMVYILTYTNEESLCLKDKKNKILFSSDLKTAIACLFVQHY
jgi:hypothetical protein